MSRYFAFILIWIGLLPSLKAQYGPGGVGDSSTVSMWLRADTNSIFSDLGSTLATNGGQVQQWNDYSGNDRHVTQTVAANRPFLRLNQANGFPGVRFTGNTFIDGPALGIAGTSSYTYILTFRDTATSLGGLNDGNGHYILDRTTATDNLAGLKPITGNFYGYQKRNDAGNALGGPLTTTSINTNIKSIEMRRLYNTNYQIIYNGSLQATLAGADGAITPPNPRIGRHATGVNLGINGYIYEISIFGFALNLPQTIIVNNYLAAKYNYALSASDIYVQDDPANGNFDFEVAGIGRENATSLHNDAKGSGIVRILNPTGLGNNEFLIWGHDGGVLDGIETTDIPSGIDARMQRVWRVNEVNGAGTAVNVGNIDMRWDLNGLGSVTASDLRLLIDTDNDASFTDETPISGATSLGGGIYQFAAVSQITNNVRFSLGTINSIQTPLPIELLFFNVTPKDGKALIQWQTATESNNSHFILERSIDGQHWNFMAELEAAGNSISQLSYTYTDISPIEGISYYRLKDCDFDDNCKLSAIAAFQTGNEKKSSIVAYPNPVSDFLTIEGVDEKDFIAVYNSIGLKMDPPIISNPSQSLLIDVSNLTIGSYMLVTISGTIRFEILR